MEKKKITVSISAWGAARVDTEGFKGEACKDATKVIEKALAEGKGKTETVIKEEWYQQEDHAGGTHIESKQNW